ncbi:hypothetical protein [Phenylobacterium sp.]|uniref:hypothetical protein n=1 Tax=Phenylobacterium sp. TaxID=1871053 RepID=UPI0035B41166
MDETIARALAELPPLWTTESRDTDEIVLPVRLSTRWRRLTWYPVEREGEIVFGLTLVTVPEWRHFHVEEFGRLYGGFPVAKDASHLARRVPRVPEIAMHRLDDLTPFVPSRPKVWP